jgi:hypothetical protein
MSADELDLNERKAFLEWRRGLAELQEDENLLLTPFEKNLEVWRQLWRVIERRCVCLLSPPLLCPTARPFSPGYNCKRSTAPGETT